MKLLRRLDGFMLYGKMGIDFFSTSELFYPSLKIRLLLIRARPNFYMISDKPNVSRGIIDYSLYTRSTALKEDYRKNRMDMLAYAPVEYNFFGNFDKDIHHACDKKLIHSRKQFQQCSHSSSRNCKEQKLCLHWFVY